MRSSRLFAVLLPLAFAGLLPAAGSLAQSGLRVPDRADATGIDPSFARGWLSPDFDRFGFVHPQWRDAPGVAPARGGWTYSFGERAALGLSYSTRAGDFGPQRYGLVGRYSLSPSWSLNAEAGGREPGTVLRLQDLRIGFERRF